MITKLLRTAAFASATTVYGIAMTPTEIVDDLNRKAGVSKAQASAMKAGSLFGWHCPAADPRNYDGDGKPKNGYGRNVCD